MFKKIDFQNVRWSFVLSAGLKKQKIDRNSAAAYQVENTSSRTITEVKQVELG